MTTKKTETEDQEAVDGAEPEALVPNVQSEPDHASQAPEDTRDAEVAKPNA